MCTQALCVCEVPNVLQVRTRKQHLEFWAISSSYTTARDVGNICCPIEAGFRRARRQQGGGPASFHLLVHTARRQSRLNETQSPGIGVFPKVGGGVATKQVGPEVKLRKNCESKSSTSAARPFPSPSCRLIQKTKECMEELRIEKHVDYIKSLDQKKDMETLLTEHLRMSGAYWGLNSMDLMGHLADMDQEAIISWLLQCQHDSGGFSGNIDHDPHILYTLSAVQILALYHKLDLINKDKVADYLSQLQQEDGSFAGDEWGEIDTRFSYCAICCLSLLKQLDKINLKKAVEFVASCKNFDGGFGCTPGDESHAGQIFCCVGALAIAGALHHVDKDLLGWWLCERQVQSGGLNGRPEKLPDVCYSWWVLSSLVIIDRVHWINKDKLKQFILDCQDKEHGGISDRPDDAVDVFHTFFGIAGLSLLEYAGLKPIDPAYALPVDVVDWIFYSCKEQVGQA